MKKGGTVGFYANKETCEMYKSCDAEKKAHIKKILIEMIRAKDVKTVSAPIAAPKPAEPVAKSPILQNTTPPITIHAAPRAPVASPKPSAPAILSSPQAQNSPAAITNYTAPRAPPVFPKPPPSPAINSPHMQSATPLITRPKAPPMTMQIDLVRD